MFNKSTHTWRHQSSCHSGPRNTISWGEVWIYKNIAILHAWERWIIYVLINIISWLVPLVNPCKKWFSFPFRLKLYCKCTVWHHKILILFAKVSWMKNIRYIFHPDNGHRLVDQLNYFFHFHGITNKKSFKRMLENFANHLFFIQS